ncbi:hypothetical protein AB0B89_19665 [Sphaerisporangium sp. NPDC049002]|uniref:hypothetical protein n=1 Tax=Sphaerisporangium sp. NPDC049002 TaxID=3155392 RepID=UPI0033C915D4
MTGSISPDRQEGGGKADMGITSDVVSQSTAAYYGTLLGGLNDGLRKHGIRGLVVRVIRLRLLFDDLGIPGYVSPELEVRGADNRLRVTVTIVTGKSEPAYCVRPAGDAPQFLFPVDEGREALAYLVGTARDWQVAR